MERQMTESLARIAFVLMFSMVAPVVHAQIGDPATLIKEKLVSEIKLTKATDAHDDIVTEGDVVQLHKDGLIMCSSDSPRPYPNTYKNGALSGDWRDRVPHSRFPIPHSDVLLGNRCPTRKFVTGEKFWVTDIRIAGDNSGIIVSTFSEAYNNTRYYGEIKFPFPSRNSIPPVDDEVKTVDEVFTVVPSDVAGKGQDNAASQDPSGLNQPQSGQAAGASAQVASAPSPAVAPAAALAPIAPPPPPADPPPQQTKTIAVGQTKAAVLATWGQPTKDIQLNTKEILVYPDMKVTFVAGKVSDVQ
jgi:hypothetical protein